MGFISGMIVGIAIGIVLIVAFARQGSVRSKRRSDLLSWLNSQVEKIWPFVNEAASELIRTNVEPILEQYRPIILSSLTFSKLTLGTVAPQFTGVTIVEENSGPEGVTMDLEMQWDGNPNIVLDIKTRVGVVLPVQVKNIGFTGVFRLIFKPLVDEFPAFGAVCFSLKEKKDLDFTLKVIGGDLSTLPGISDAIEETIRDAIEDSITWPVRKVIPILPGDYSNLELKPVGKLEVKLVQAKNLTNKDIVGKSDPYAVIFVRPLRDRTKTSKIMNNQLNPVWNEHFEFIIEDASTQHLTVRIFDDEGVQASELIGCAQVSLKDLEPGKVKDVWLKLVKDLEVHRDNKYRGEVHLELLYCPFGVESAIRNPFDPDFSLTTFEKTLKSGTGDAEAEDLIGSRRRNNVIVRGVLSVTVISAEDLPAVDLMGKADPFVVLLLKKTEKKLKTRVVNESLNPVWNQTFDFVVEDGLHEMLILEVYDHDTFGKEKIGRVILTLTKVILEGEYNETYPLDGAKSGNISLHLKWTPQHKFRDP
ncbi:Synaptotagmin-4 [Glycine soja]|uniref:Synaptotagmin-4 n=1 Tax=Glycine soja TaxID=3848 RepID=A0A445K5L3_GLYSO|nr:Synaptotagmin-4 [Glycine soja]